MLDTSLLWSSRQRDFVVAGRRRRELRRAGGGGADCGQAVAAVKAPAMSATASSENLPADDPVRNGTAMGHRGRHRAITGSPPRRLGDLRHAPPSAATTCTRATDMPSPSTPARAPRLTSTHAAGRHQSSNAVRGNDAARESNNRLPMRAELAAKARVDLAGWDL